MTGPAASRPLDEQELAARIAELRRDVGARQDEPVQAEAEASYRYVRPLLRSVESLEETLQNPDGRWMFGLSEIDTRLRGVGRGELCLVVGFAHSGKTQIVLHSVLHNRGKRVLFVTFDEVSELVLLKLLCTRLGVDAELLEARIRARDEDVLRTVRRTVQSELKNLLVIDQPLELGQLAEALAEAERYWQAEADVIVLDYLNLVRCDADTVEGKSEAVSRWTKDVNRPVVCIHQAGRGSSGQGQPITLTSGKYGGEQEAIFMLGVRRRRDDESLDAAERARHADTISVSIVKNKRPPCKLTPVEGIDYWMDATSGRIRALRDADLALAAA